MPELYVNLMGCLRSEDEYFAGDDSPDSQPYAVQVCFGHWIPISVLIFAQSKDDAIKRVCDSLNLLLEQAADEAAERQGITKTDLTWNASQMLELAKQHSGRIASVANAFVDGEVRAELFDKRYLARVDWSSNATLA